MSSSEETSVLRNRRGNPLKRSLSHSDVEQSHSHVYSSESKLPKPNTNVSDVMNTNIHEYGKRFTIVGLNYECHLFKSVSNFIDHLQHEAELRSEPSISHMLSSGERVWIDIQDASKSDMTKLQDYFELHPLTIEDCLNSDSAEKWEFFDDYMFVVFTAQIDDECLPPIAYRTIQHPMIRRSNTDETQLSIVVFSNYVITIHDVPIKGLDIVLKRIEAEHEIDLSHSTERTRPASRRIHKYDFDQLKLHSGALTTSASRQSLQSFDSRNDLHHEFEDYSENEEIVLKIPILDNEPEPDLETTHEPTYSFQSLTDDTTLFVSNVCKKTTIPSSSWVLYAFLDALVDMYIPFVDALLAEVDNLDDFVFELQKNEQSDLVKRISVAKRNIVTLRRFLRPKQKMTTYLVSQEIPFLSREVKVYLRDVLDHLQICVEKLEDARENLNQTHSNYLTMVQTDIAEASAHTDTFMDRITVFAALWGPLTLISGLWGMNVRVPGGDNPSLWWFFGIVLGMVALTVVMAIILRKKLLPRSLRKE